MTNCNMCGHDCLGGLCTTGQCQPVQLIGSQADPAGIAVDSTSVYWTNSSGGQVNKIPIGGGTVTPIATGQMNPGGIAVDSANAYWADYNDGTIHAASIGGNGTVSPIASSLVNPVSVALYNGNVYWTNSEQGNSGAGNVGFATTAGYGVVYTVGSSYLPWNLVVVGNTLYWTSNSDGSQGLVFSAPAAANSTVKTLVTQTQSGGADYTSAFAVAGALYYSSCFSNAIKMAPLAGGNATPIVTGQCAAGLAADGSYLYWTQSGSGGGPARGSRRCRSAVRERSRLSPAGRRCRSPSPSTTRPCTGRPVRRS
jgi:hypothetical protein